MEGPEPDVVPPADGDEVLLCAPDAPLRGNKALFLATIGMAKHDLEATTGTCDVLPHGGHGEHGLSDRGCVAERGAGFEQRHDRNSVQTRPVQEPRRGQDIRGRFAAGDNEGAQWHGSESCMEICRLVERSRGAQVVGSRSSCARNGLCKRGGKVCQSRGFFETRGPGEESIDCLTQFLGVEAHVDLEQVKAKNTHLPREAVERWCVTRGGGANGIDVLDQSLGIAIHPRWIDLLV